MSDKPAPNKPHRIQVKVQVPSDLESTYANFALISHSPSEMIMDFAQVMPQQPQARVQARVVMTPLNAKLLHRALTENLAKYEAQFGEIKTPNLGPTLAEQFFSSRPPDSAGDD